MTSVRLYPSGRDIECRAGDTVLGALERGGYALPNNCRAGACGECRVRVRSGTFDQGMVLDMALSSEDREAGFGLMCMAKPLSETLEIEWGTADAQPRLFPPRENVPFVVVDRIRRTPKMVELHLRPIGDPLRFWPGQYVMLGDPANGRPPRPYSIANAPRPDGELMLLVSRVEGGATSPWLCDQLLVGTTVTIAGAYGTFIGDPSVETPVVCLAAGSGLAPILALTDAALRRGFSQPVTILFSARDEDGVACRGLMAWWAARNTKFRFLVTHTGIDPSSDGLHGRIPTLLADLFGDLSTTSVFIAGSPDFVTATAAAATAVGAVDPLLHTEAYVPGQAAQTPAGERLVLR